MTTWVDILNRAVKIFGGIIYLSGKFIISKMNHKHKFEKGEVDIIMTPYNQKALKILCHLTNDS